MIRATLILIAAMLVAAPAWAQRAQPLRGAEDASRFCVHSAPRAAEEEGSEDYDAARRAAAQRPVEVWLGAVAAPVIGYERVTGALEISLYRPATFAAGYKVASNLGTADFELPEDVAQRLWARYESGNATLKLTFLPVAWSDYERPLCRKDGEEQVLDAEVLAVELVDELGKSLVRQETRLGREVALMRQHRVKGYLDSGIPVVTVSALTVYPAREGTSALPDEGRLRSDIRAALYGCYLRGLAANGRMQGALVVKLAPGEQNATVLVDSLHDDATCGCAMERLGEVVRASALTEPLKATVIFRLEEAPSL